MSVIDKIKTLIKQQKIIEAKELLKKIAKTKQLCNPENIEDLFSVLVSVSPVLRFFLKHLAIEKVPQTPIDTNFDTGRRFFYALYIINRFGGMRFVTPYINDIKVNRLLEYRFLGGIHYFNMNYKKAKEAYQKSFDFIQNEDFDEFKHLFIYGNLAVCYLYLNDTKSYEELKNQVLLKTKDHPSVIRVFEKYDVFMHTHLGDYKSALLQYEKCKEKGFYKKSINLNEAIYIETYIAAINEDINIFRKQLREMLDNFYTNIYEGNFTPERLIGTIAYISTFTIHPKESWQDIIHLEKITYPFPDITIREKFFSSLNFKSMGPSTAPNYINYTTEEYSIKNKTGIGLNNELKAIYWIIRSHQFGISFETLASLIYTYDDFAGLFLIRERIKQIVNRLNKHYEMNLKISIYRVYIEPEELQKFYIFEDKQYKIPDNFSIYNFMDFYQISNSKAQKIINKLLKEDVITKNIIKKKNIYTFKE